MNTQCSKVPATKPIVAKRRPWAAAQGTPWEVVFPKRGVIPNKRRFFKTEEEANTAISEWKNGKVSVALGKHKIDSVFHCESLLPAGVTILDAVRYYLEHHTGASSVTLQDVTKSYLTDLRNQNRAAKYREEQERMVRIILSELGPLTLVSSLVKPKLLGFIKAGSTYWNRYSRNRIVSVLVTKARELDAIKADPLDGWVFEDAPTQGRPHFLKQSEVETFLAYAKLHRPELVPAFALQLFAGIRTEELCRVAVNGKRALAWSDLKWGQEIDVGSEVSKTNTRRTIRHWPAALNFWMGPAVSQSPSKGFYGPSPLALPSGPVCSALELDDIKSKLVKAMNAERTEAKLPVVPFKQNDFRRTYATHSYNYPEVGVSKTRDYMGHTETSGVLEKRYAGYVTETEASAYFQSSP